MPKDRKKESVIKLEPPQVLTFYLPTKDEQAKDSKAAAVTAVLKISNPTGSAIKFKVKTTAPKKYCVKPNSGSLNPNSSVTVDVMLQPNPDTKQLPRPQGDCKDKFLVQTVQQSDCIDEHWQSADLWRLVPEEKIMSDKMKCAWREAVLGAPSAPSAQQAPVKPEPTAEPAKSRPVAKKVVANAGVSSAVPVSKPAVGGGKASAISPTAKPSRPSAASGETALAEPSTNTAKLYLLVMVFVLGVIFGKFLL